MPPTACPPPPRVPLLTAAEECGLARRRDAGDPDAVAELVARNEGLVLHVALRYRGRGLDDDDLLQHGRVGLLVAARKFDPARGCRFSTMATWWVRQAIRRGLFEDRGVVRVPVHAAARAGAAAAATAALSARLGRGPTSAELAAALGCPVHAARMAATAARLGTPASIDAPGPAGVAAATLPDRRDAADAERADALEAAREAVAAVRAALHVLDPREVATVILRRGFHGAEPWTLRQVGALWGLTRERARQLQDEAETKIYLALRRRPA